MNLDHPTRPEDVGAEIRCELDALLALPDLGDAQRRYLTERWQPNVLLAKRRVEANRRSYYRWKVPTVLGALLVPPLASPTVDAHWARWAAFVVSLVVAICSAIEGTYRFGNRWRVYRRMLDELRTDGWAYAQRIGPYASRADFARFVERNERVIRQYGDEYLTDVLAPPPGESHSGPPASDSEPVLQPVSTGP
jgi:hypothetical protein